MFSKLLGCHQETIRNSLCSGMLTKKYCYFCSYFSCLNWFSNPLKVPSSYLQQLHFDQLTKSIPIFAPFLILYSRLSLNIQNSHGRLSMCSPFDYFLKYCNAFLHFINKLWFTFGKFPNIYINSGYGFMITIWVIKLKP